MEVAFHKLECAVFQTNKLRLGAIKIGQRAYGEGSILGAVQGNHIGSLCNRSRFVVNTKAHIAADHLVNIHSFDVVVIRTVNEQIRNRRIGYGIAAEHFLHLY